MKRLLILCLLLAYPAFGQITTIPGGGGGGGAPDAHASTHEDGGSDPVTDLGAITPNSVNGITVTSSAGSTLTIAAGKTVTINHGITISGGDSTVLTFPDDSVTFTATPTGDAGVIADASGLIADDWLPPASGVLEWFIQTPAVAASHVIMKSLPDMQAGTITAIHCQACNELACTTTTAAVDINLDARAFSTPGSAGTDIHTSELTCDEDGFTTTTLSGDPTNAANEAWNLSISAVTDATILRVWATVEID